MVEEAVDDNDGEVNNFDGDDGWDVDEGGDDEGGWDDEEEDELDDVVKQALEQTRKKKEMEEKISDVRIAFRPPNYHAMTIARIVADFTDWVPITMHMHQVKDI